MNKKYSEKKEAYLKKLKDPRWQKIRLQVLSRDEWTCQICADVDSTLHVHHKFYMSHCEPWEYHPEYLITLCESCHQSETEKIPPIMEGINRLLKHMFFADELYALGEGLSYLSFKYNKNVHADALAWFFKNDKLQKELIERYFEHLRERKKITMKRREDNIIQFDKQGKSHGSQTGRDNT